MDLGALITPCTAQFRSLLRQSSQFSNYNFREYALRRTKDAFREHQHETQERRIQELIQEGLQSLRMMKVSRDIPSVRAPDACRNDVDPRASGHPS
jgi:hypothetical protein